jgi:predicted  nucleic acid-binding Zn-ribbon protein
LLARGQLADIGRVARTGYHVPMTTTVECAHCGAVYETEAPVAAIREVSRCQECGVTALLIVEEERSADGRDSADRASER